MLGHGDGVWIDRTNTAATTDYVPKINDDDGWCEMVGMPVVTLQLEVSGGVTATIEASLNKAKDATKEWFDISAFFTDLETGAAGTASWTDTNALLQANGLNVELLRVKLVRSDTSNAEKVIARRM